MEARCRCTSPLLYAPSGFVSLNVCRSRCPYVDHPPREGGVAAPPVGEEEAPAIAPRADAGSAPAGEPFPQPKPPCRHEGAVVSYCPCRGSMGELRHVRQCLFEGWPEGHPEQCTRADRQAAVPCCLDCPHYAPQE